MQTNRSDATNRADVLARGTAAAVLMVAAIAALAITSVIRGNQPANAQSGAAVQPAPRAFSVPLDSGEVGPFAFGYLEYDWDPNATGGVPGFDSWPPGSPRR